MSLNKCFYFCLGVTFLICLIGVVYVLIKPGDDPKTDDEPFSSLFESNSRQCNLFSDGQIVNEGEFPYLVLIRSQVNSNEYGGCSGILIDKRIVLTDAHCIRRRTNVEVFVSSSSEDSSFWDLISNKHQAKVERTFVVIDSSSYIL